MRDIFDTGGEPEPFETELLMKTFYTAYEAGSAIEGYRILISNGQSHETALQEVATNRGLSADQLFIWLKEDRPPEQPSS